MDIIAIPDAPESTAQSSPTSSSHPFSKKKVNVAAIAGGAAGGVVVAAILAALITFVLIRRRRSKNEQFLTRPQSGPTEQSTYPASPIYPISPYGPNSPISPSTPMSEKKLYVRRPSLLPLSIYQITIHRIRMTLARTRHASRAQKVMDSPRFLSRIFSIPSSKHIIRAEIPQVRSQLNIKKESDYIMF